MNKQNRIALVTGASRKNGIGAAIARELARNGIDIFTTYFRPVDREAGFSSNPEEPQELLAEIRNMGRNADGLEVDLSEPSAPRKLFDYVEANFGPVNILVNNAAYSTEGGINTINADILDKHYAVNIRAMTLLCAEFVSRYPKDTPAGKHGRIINLSSGQSVGPMPSVLAYATTKGAVEAFTVSLSAEVASLGITVNAIDPGATDTGWMSSEIRANLEAKSPMGRVGMPEDAARLIRFLSSEDAGWITGQIHHSRGGA